MTDTLSPAQQKQIGEILAGLRHKPGALLPILHAVQDRLGYVPPESVPLIALDLNLTRAEIHGVISFYHYFRSTPPGRHTVQLCRAESCQAAGGDALASHIKKSLGVEEHQTTADGGFTLEPVYCLGLCACSPALMIDGEPHGRVTHEKFDKLMNEVKRA